MSDAERKMFLVVNGVDVSPTLVKYLNFHVKVTGDIHFDIGVTYGHDEWGNYKGLFDSDAPIEMTYGWESSGDRSPEFDGNVLIESISFEPIDHDVARVVMSFIWDDGPRHLSGDYLKQRNALWRMQIIRSGFSPTRNQTGRSK